MHSAERNGAGPALTLECVNKWVRLFYLSRIYVLAGEWPKQADEFIAVLPDVERWCAETGQGAAAGKVRWLMEHFKDDANVSNEAVADAMDIVCKVLHKEAKRLLQSLW